MKNRIEMDQSLQFLECNELGGSGFNENNLRQSFNQIIISECRICLQGNSQTSQDHLIAPCLCTGSVKYVHFKCMAEWIVRNKEAQLLKAQKVGTFDCEMCKHKIKYELAWKKRCKQSEQFLESLKKNCFTFVFLTAVIAAGISLLLFIIFLIAYDGVVNFSPQNLFECLIILASMILLIILVVISFYLCCSQYLIIKDFRIIQISNLNNTSRENLNSPEINFRKRSTSTIATIYPMEMLVVQDLD